MRTDYDAIAVLQRAGMTIVPNEAAAILAYIVSNGQIDPSSLNSMLLDMKLVEIVPYDPNEHTGGSPDMLPGDPYMKYSPGLMEVLRVGGAHLGGVRQ